MSSTSLTMDSSSDTLGDIAAQDLPFRNANGYNLPYNVLPSLGLQTSRTPTPSFSHAFEACEQQKVSFKQSHGCNQENAPSDADSLNETSVQVSSPKKIVEDTGVTTDKIEGAKIKCKYCSIRMAMLRQLEERKSAKSTRRRTVSSEISSSQDSGSSTFDRGCQTSASLFKQAPMSKKEMRCFMIVLRYRNGKPLRTETFCNCALRGLEDDCACGENNTRIEWLWDLNKQCDSAYVQPDPRTVIFHKGYSCGTAAISGNQLMDRDQYFWEIKMTTPVYGTDMMVGVGTTGVDLNGYHNQFCSMLGTDGDSWGFSYDGRLQHNGRKRDYCGRYGQGAIVGAHLDMWHGTLTFYKNRRNLGIAYRGLRGKSLYPMACSTAARSAMRIVSSTSFPSSLQYLCARLLRKLVPDHLNVLDVLQMPPGLRRLLSKTLGWLLQAPYGRSPGQASSNTSSSSSHVCGICSPLKNVFEGYTDDEGESNDEDNVHNGFNYLDSDDEDSEEESDEEEIVRPTFPSLHREQKALVERLGQSVVTSLSNLPLYRPSSSSSGVSSPKRRRLDMLARCFSQEEEEKLQSEQEERNSESEDSILEQDGNVSPLSKSESSEENLSSPGKYVLGKRKKTER